jgi:hypothetical protein
MVTNFVLVNTRKFIELLSIAQNESQMIGLCYDSDKFYVP